MAMSGFAFLAAAHVTVEKLEFFFLNCFLPVAWAMEHEVHVTFMSDLLCNRLAQVLAGRRRLSARKSCPRIDFESLANENSHQVIIKSLSKSPRASHNFFYQHTANNKRWKKFSIVSADVWLCATHFFYNSCKSLVNLAEIDENVFSSCAIAKQ